MGENDDSSASAYDWFATAVQAATAYSSATANKPAASMPANSQAPAQITNNASLGSNKTLIYVGVGLGALVLVVLLVKR